MDSRDQKVGDLDEADIDRYMDAENANGAGPTAKERTDFLRARHKAICDEYKSLMLLREEAKATENKQRLAQLREAFEANYRTRKWVVRELRAAGETVEDRFVPA
jgi:hypothetical protein